MPKFKDQFSGILQGEWTIYAVRENGSLKKLFHIRCINDTWREFSTNILDVSLSHYGKWLVEPIDKRVHGGIGWKLRLIVNGREQDSDLGVLIQRLSTAHPIMHLMAHGWERDFRDQLNIGIYTDYSIEDWSEQTIGLKLYYRREGEDELTSAYRFVWKRRK